MEKVYIQTGERMSVVKQNHKVSLFPKDGEVMLGNNVLSGLACEAFICKYCKKIVLDDSETDYLDA